MTEFSDLLNKSYDEIKNEGFSFSSPFDNTQSATEIIILNGNALSNNTITVDKRIEDKSKVILDTFNDIMRKTFEPVMNNSIVGIDYAKSIAPRDFSSLISSLSRILEIEMNLSVVQMVRNSLGVKMPENFNKVASDKDEMWIDKEIRLNRSVKGELSPLSLGSIDILMKKMRKNLHGNIKDYSYDLCDVLEKLRIPRNTASHDVVEDEECFVSFYKNFCVIMERGWFSELMNIKQELRGY